MIIMSRNTIVDILKHICAHKMYLGLTCYGGLTPNPPPESIGYAPIELLPQNWVFSPYGLNNSSANAAYPQQVFELFNAYSVPIIGYYVSWSPQHAGDHMCGGAYHGVLYEEHFDEPYEVIGTGFRIRINLLLSFAAWDGSQYY